MWRRNEGARDGRREGEREGKRGWEEKRTGGDVKGITTRNFRNLEVKKVEKTKEYKGRTRLSIWLHTTTIISTYMLETKGQ